MRLRLLNLTYLAVAIIATSWVLIDIFSAVVLDGAKGTASFEGTYAALLNIPILAGLLFLLLTLYNSPVRIRNHKRRKSKSGRKTNSKTASTALKRTSPKKSSADKSSRDKAAQDSQADHDSKLSKDSTMLFQESTTIDVDDFFATPPEEANHSEYDDEGQPIEFSGETSPESLEPLAEAEVLAKFGRYDQAIETLLDAFESSEGNCDAVATKILEYLNEELDSESTSLERAAFLEFKLSETIAMFSKERAKLSDETWQKIELENSTQTEKREEVDTAELFLIDGASLNRSAERTTSNF